MTSFNPIEAARLAEEMADDAGGFEGEFRFAEAHTEDHGIGNIGDFVEVPDRIVYIDAIDEDPHTIVDDIEQHIAEPIVRMLNNARSASEQLRAAVVEVDRLRAKVSDMRSEAVRAAMLTPLTAEQVKRALHEGRAEAMAATGDNAWTTLLLDRDRLAARVGELEGLVLSVDDIVALRFAMNVLRDEWSDGRDRQERQAINVLYAVIEKQLDKRFDAIRAALGGGK